MSIGLLVLLAGLGLRIGLLVVAPRYGFFTDHLDFMVWSLHADRAGPAAIYDLPANTLINANLPPPFAEALSPRLAGRMLITPYPSLITCNYPPLSIYFFWLQGRLWNTLEPTPPSHDISAPIAGFLEIERGQVQSPIANTIASRCVAALLPTLAELLLAVGAVHLARLINIGAWKSSRGLMVFALVWLGPPFLLNSAFWGQTDAIVTTLMLWTLIALLSQRLLLAGVLLGAALMTKAQAVLLFPAIAAVFMVFWRGPGGSLRGGLALWRTAVAALLTIAVLSAPFMIHDASSRDGDPLRWFVRSYVEPIRAQFPYTTVRAFNVWWLDFLVEDQKEDALNPATKIAGVQKSMIGSTAFILAILGSAVVAVRRFGFTPAAVVAFTALVLFAAFVWPTRVHERYFYYGLPFVIAAATRFRHWWIVVALLFVVGTAEMTWNLWLMPGNAPLEGAAEGTFATVLSGLLAGMTVAGFFLAILSLLLPISPAPGQASIPIPDPSRASPTAGPDGSE